MDKTQEFYYQTLVKCFKNLSDNCTIINYLESLLNDLVDSYILEIDVLNKIIKSYENNSDDIALMLLMNIQKELNFDVNLLFDCLRYGIYISDDNFRDKHSIQSINKIADSWCVFTNFSELPLLLKDYGNTWILSK